MARRAWIFTAAAVLLPQLLVADDAVSDEVETECNSADGTCTTVRVVLGCVSGDNTIQSAGASCVPDTGIIFVGERNSVASLSGSSSSSSAVGVNIDKLLAKSAVPREEDGYLPSVGLRFTRPQQDGSSPLSISANKIQVQWLLFDEYSSSYTLEPLEDAFKNDDDRAGWTIKYDNKLKANERYWQFRQIRLEDGSSAALEKLAEEHPQWAQTVIDANGDSAEAMDDINFMDDDDEELADGAADWDESVSGDDTYSESRWIDMHEYSDVTADLWLFKKGSMEPFAKSSGACWELDQTTPVCGRSAKYIHHKQETGGRGKVVDFKFEDLALDGTPIDCLDGSFWMALVAHNDSPQNDHDWVPRGYPKKNDILGYAPMGALNSTGGAGDGAFTFEPSDSASCPVPTTPAPTPPPVGPPTVTATSITATATTATATSVTGTTTTTVTTVTHVTTITTTRTTATKTTTTLAPAVCDHLFPDDSISAYVCPKALGDSNSACCECYNARMGESGDQLLALFETNCTLLQIVEVAPPSPPSTTDDECTGTCCSFLEGLVIDGESLVTCTAVWSTCFGPCQEITFFPPDSGGGDDAFCWWCILIVVIAILATLLTLWFCWGQSLRADDLAGGSKPTDTVTFDGEKYAI